MPCLQDLWCLRDSNARPFYPLAASTDGPYGKINTLCLWFCKKLVGCMPWWLLYWPQVTDSKVMQSSLPYMHVALDAQGGLF
jgi:hypothetical protein